MKKKINLIITIIVLLLSIGFFNKYIIAAPGFRDQFNESDAGFSLPISNYGHAEIFKPTTDRISGISVYLRERESDKTVTLTLKDEKSGETLWSRGHKMVGGNGWEDFFFEPINIKSGNQYGIYLDAVGTQTKWAVSNKNIYPNGFSKKRGQIDNNDDFLFVERGFNSSDNKVDALAVDKNIKSPVLVNIAKNDQKIDYYPGQVIEILSKNQLEISGTYDANNKNSKIIIYIGKERYVGSAESSGKWSFNFDPATLKEGDYEISTKLQLGDKTSERMGLFTLKKIPEKPDAPQEKLSLWRLLLGPYFWYMTGTLLLLLIIMVLLFFYLETRNKEI